MNQIDAVKVLIEAVQVANKAGAYSLQDSGTIAQAVAVLTQPKAEAPTKPEKKK